MGASLRPAAILRVVDPLLGRAVRHATRVREVGGSMITRRFVVGQRVQIEIEIGPQAARQTQMSSA
jgi:hypothetical protein